MVKTSYISVIAIWSTTPLAIQWSIEAGLFFSLLARMSIGLLVMLMIFLMTKHTFKIDKQAWYAYMIAGLGIYFSMSLVYWGAQYIPSGWISVIFGLSPIITGIISIIFLNENHFNLSKSLGMILGVTGLFVIFKTGAQISLNSFYGVLALLLSTFTHSLSAVMLKRLNASISGIDSTFGGLIIAVPLLGVTFLLLGEELATISSQAIISIIYLGAIATAIGFSMYYYILQKLNVIRVSLITLITPVSALFIGMVFNDEAITVSVILGTALIMLGLVLFEIRQEQFSLGNKSNK